jgi:Domain of unknown function (DUF4395)
MEIDPRGPRFGALLTLVVFAAVLITGSGWLLAAQGLVFAAGTFLGLQRSPYGLLYRVAIRPRLGPPAELEAEAPPRFAQALGLLICVIGVIGYGTGVTVLGMAATAAGLLAAFLNGVFGLCLGCEMYVVIRRIWPGRQLSGPGPV